VAPHGLDGGSVLLAGRTLTSLERLLAPRSIALIGASADPRKFGGRPLAALRRHGFDGDLWVVNPRYDDIDGVPCVAAVEELPAAIDLAAVLLPAEGALEALEGLAGRDVGAAAVFAGGFGETGAAGADLQRRLGLLVEHGMRLLGPNCPGFVNARARVACSASAYAQRDSFPAGRVAFVSQSGAVAGIVADRALSRGVGVNAVVCTGNEADVDSAELLRWFAEDPHTDAVGLFLEGLGRDRRLAEAVAFARERRLGIAALKVGRSELARAVVASHTAAVVGDDGAFDALCASLGVVRAHDYDELLEATQLLAAAPGVGRRVALAGSSGGMNTLLADAGAERGIELPELRPATVERIAAIAPDFGTAGNPVDISSAILLEPERLGAALEELGRDPGVESVVMVIGDHPPDLSRRFATIAADAAARTGVPVVIQWSAGELSLGGIQEAGRRGLAVVTEPTRCARLLAAVARAGAAVPSAIAATRPGRPAAPALDGAGSLSEAAGKALLERAGLRVPRRRLLADPAGADAAVRALGGVAVVKADCVGSVHKTDAGAIAVGVRPEQAGAVAESVLAAARSSFGAGRVRGLLVEEQVEPVAELLVSASVDAQIGPLVTVGLGGQLVELMSDTVSRLAPVDPEQALAMLAELRATALLDGPRGRPCADREALAELIARVSELGVAWQERLDLLELNPVAALERGAVVLDAVMEVRP
jgi:acetate---CoA ligase (ADP-forming)